MRPARPATAVADTRFGEGGVALVEFASGSDELRSLAVAGDGTILLAGASGDHAARVGALARLDEHGLPDASFGAGGTVEVQPGARLFDCAVERCASACACAAVAPRDDGSLAAAASVDLDDAAATRRWALLRVTADGRLDDAAPGGGSAPADDDDRVHAALVAAALDADGFPSGPYLLVRFTPDGRRDRRFGTDGHVVTGAVQTPAPPIVAVEDPRRVGGRLGTSYVERRLADGGLDASFGADGTAPVALPAGSFAVRALALTPDGGLLVGGTLAVPSAACADCTVMAVAHLAG